MWWEKGCLGIDYADAPQWMTEAFGILNTEIDMASKLRREMDKATKPARVGR